MNPDVAWIPTAHPVPVPVPVAAKLIRTDRAPQGWDRPSSRSWMRLALVGLALGFVVVGVDGLDVGAGEARLGLAAGEGAGPLGQVAGYWAPDLWPAQVLSSLGLARLAPGGRPSTAAVRWPAALAGILAGWLLARGMNRRIGGRAAILFGFCWFGSLAMIDRSAGAGLDLILGLATVAAIDRLLTRGWDSVAGAWAALGFLAGGWPALVLIGLAILVIGRPGSPYSLRLILPPLVIAVVWSALTIATTSAELWAAALTFPLTRGRDSSMGVSVVLLGLPWSPFALLAASPSIRGAWPADARAWVTGWIQVALVGFIAGSLIPGLGPAARTVMLAGLLVGGGACLESLWARTLSPATRRVFFLLFSVLLALWLIVMAYGGFLWIVTMPYYRGLGIAMGLLVLAVAILGSSALATSDPRRGLATLILLAVGLKLAYWGYYAPEWNYRRSQGPWGRAIGQWIPRKWPVYTFHNWPADLSFFIGRPVRQLRSPRFLEYFPGPESRFVLLLPSEYDHWPAQAPPITPVARFQDGSGEERLLARTDGLMPLPGQGLALAP